MEELFVLVFRFDEEYYRYLVETYPLPDDGNFSTQVPGGFGSLTYTLAGTMSDNTTRLSAYISCFVKVVDKFDQVVYEGKVQSLKMTEQSLNVSCIGLVDIAKEQLNDLIYIGGVGTETYAHDIIIDVTGIVKAFNDIDFILRDDVDGAIKSTDIDLGYIDFTDAMCSEALDRAIKYGYQSTDLRPYYYAVWQDRVMHAFPEPKMDNMKNKMQWAYILDEGDNAMTYTFSRDNVINKVWYTFDDNSTGGEGPTRNAEADTEESLVSQRLYGIKEEIVLVSESGEAEAATVAEIKRIRSAYPVPAFTLKMNWVMRFYGGGIEPTYHVRAGDLISIKNSSLVGTSSDLQRSVPDAFFTAFVRSTSYNHSDGSISITVERTDRTVEYVLNRWEAARSLG